MNRFPFMLSFVALVLAVAIALACGAGQSQLQSITLSPATADAQSYPNGLVPFIATGHYVSPSHTVTPLPATWSACYQGIPTTDVSVTTAGVAQCAAAATGTYSVFAVASSGKSCNDAVGPCGNGCSVVGTALLTCP
ncbi:MAG: hypothetical protein LAO30_10270 [Acidobacteriia bacterium]|nr:hypothetical protein [Terriglobia bacterium]